MIIRPATAADLEAIVAMGLHFAESSIYGRLFATNPMQIRTLAIAILGLEASGQGTVLLAEEGGAAIGMLGLVAAPNLIAGIIVAEELCWWVEPAWRSTRAGIRLLRAAEAWAKVRRLSVLRMIGPADKPELGAFYARLGYVPVETAYILRL